ncbi:hypothetical protein [Streptomyces hygroscopicus]|uniref:hypothetical protein n=1 Tax=Streptomyces hygroscopicus TaxID=1912 RepID=UPI001FCA99CD|nr:hypothetical protein [Streptomyces hygroscopicus]BDH15313.1 hypothetical protein HOK021_64920 [Streptomyces hygroscopicus]
MSVGTGHGFRVVGELEPEALAVALAGCLGVPTADVEVAGEEYDPETRHWDAAVSCDYAAADGDVSWVLEVHVTERVAAPPGSRELALGLAAALGRVVVYEAQPYQSAACWVAVPDGRTVRGRLYDLGYVAGREGFVMDTVESPLPPFPGARTDFLYEAVSFGQGWDFGEALRAIVSALRSQCPAGRLELRGSLAGDAYDRYSDIDLLWTVPGERFAAAVAGAGEALAGACPLLTARSDPEFHDAPDRRLLTYFFRDLPLFRRLDLDVRAGTPPVGPVPAGGGWPLAVSALANAVGAVKAVRRGRDAETVRGLVERGGARVGVREVASGRWADDLARLVDAAERADPRARELAGRVRELVTAELG